MKRTIVILATISLLLVAVSCAGAKADPPTTSASPKAAVFADPVSANTYSYDPFTLSVSTKGERISFILSAKTTGWLGLGVGSTRMNQSHIFMGLVDKDNKPVFTEQIGRGHTHADAANKLAQSWSAVQNGDTLTLTVTCDKAEVLVAGAKQLGLILALSPSDDLTAEHTAMRGVTIPLE